LGGHWVYFDFSITAGSDLQCFSIREFPISVFSPWGCGGEIIIKELENPPRIRSFHERTGKKLAVMKVLI
jgi:hypothetical protein